MADRHSGKSKVLIVDDSALYRKLVTDLLSELPNVEVVGVAGTGRIALRKIEACKPDLVTLDIEMPEMDGLEVLTHLRASHPELKTIVLSHYTARGADLTLKALHLGAADYVTKPAKSTAMAQSIEMLRRELLPKISELTATSPSMEGIEQSPVIKPPDPFHAPCIARREAIAIGVSTGGPQALESLFLQMAGPIKQSLLIVQHMPPLFTPKLALQLARISPIPVKQAESGEPLRKGYAYIAPGDFHMEVRGTPVGVRIHLHQGAPENHCRPSVDVLFRSVAKCYGMKAVGVIMTGMGSDGYLGCQSLRAAGGIVIAQDEASSVVWGMPRCVVMANLASAVAPLNRMWEVIQSFMM